MNQVQGAQEGISHAAVLAEPVVVRRAVTRDIAPLASALARAFDDDPFYNWLVPRDRRGANSVTAVFELILGQMSDGLSETYTTGDTSGAALWLNPGKHALSPWSKARLAPSFARVLGWGNIVRGLRCMAHMEALHARFAPGPHLYLSVLGVDPPRQGRGVGGQLLEPMLERCDREGLLVYLETAREKNLRFYERHGFEVAAKTPHREFPTFWSMTREARRAAAPR